MFLAIFYTVVVQRGGKRDEFRGPKKKKEKEVLLYNTDLKYHAWGGR